MFVQSRVTDLAGKPLANVPGGRSGMPRWTVIMNVTQNTEYEPRARHTRARIHYRDVDGRLFFRTILLQ